MVDENYCKGAGQRKKRQERETCINNLKLSVNLGSTKERLGIHRSSRPAIDQQTYTKKPRDKFLRGSLENVSSNPFGEINVAGEESTLRRSRSLAISREDVFTNLNIPAAARHRHRRSQLIPRAKLIDRTRYVRGISPESERTLRRNQSLTPDYTTPPQSLHNFQRNSHPQISVSLSQQITKQNEEEGEQPSAYIQINNYASVNETEIDSLNSNFHNKTSITSPFQVSYENLAPDAGLSLPNYYPDSRYDTDNTDNISATDNISVTEQDSSDKRDSELEASPIWNRTYNPHDSIPYDENILLSTNSPLYDVLKERNHYARPLTQRTIRGNTPFYKENHNYFCGKPHSLPTHITTFDDDSDLSLSEDEVKYYEIEETPEQHVADANKEIDEQKVSIEYFESDSNFDEINLNNENIKVDALKCVKEEKKDNNYECNKSSYSQSNYSNIEANPLYDEVAAAPLPQSVEINNNTLNKQSKCENIKEKLTNKKSTNKTCVQVEAPSESLPAVPKTKQTNNLDNSDEYKTVVNVENDSTSETPKSNGVEKRKDSFKETKQHSHNYLREFLESQKGSKKPLQNFISKKISRAFGDRDNLSRRSTKLSNSDSNLSDNQFCSLPDVAASKNLRKCEKIDRKLRKCEKEGNVTRPSEITANRFIVNIGRHFDVTANTNIPVDFEVKISKVPKKNKLNEKSRSSITITNKPDKEKTFVEAVKDLKETLNGATKLDENQNITKPEVIGVTTKTKVNLPKAGISIESSSIKVRNEPLKRANTRIPIAKQQIKSIKSDNEIMDVQIENAKECTKEFQQKLDNMRNYWGKMTNGDNDKEKGEKEQNSEAESKCKIVDVTTKVEEVIKKFEPKEEKEEEKQPSIVQMTKQIFEQKPPANEKKPDKLSPFVKETCGFFENPYYEKESESSNQFESLNPNIVEIIENGEKTAEETCKTTKSNKPALQNGVSCKISSHVKKSEQPKNVSKTKSIPTEPEFDHIRYRVMKSDLFQKKIFANCEKESQFDGLMQYLQDYSFQELLIDNNIVIIEPIRSKVHHETSNVAKSARNVTPLLHKSSETVLSNQSIGTRRHFFYHPIRVNKEVNEDELPDPDTVKLVRQFFEGGLKRSQSSQHLDQVGKQTVQYHHRSDDPDKDHCSATDSNSNPSNISDFGSNENLYDSITSELCCEQQYVSEDILEKIRECGTSVTYYGGRVLNKRNGQPSLTKAIMEEIKGNEKRNKDCQCKKQSSESIHMTYTKNNTSCQNNKIKRTINDAVNNFNNIETLNNNKDVYQGVKFRLLKSNSCSSRLELVGTNNLQEYRKKFLSKQKQLIEEHNLKNQNSASRIEEVNAENVIAKKEESNVQNKDISKTPEDKNLVNESIKAQKSENVTSNQPKIIGEERKTDKKMTQWGDIKDEKTYASIKFSSNKSPQKIKYDYHNYDKLKGRPKKIDDMEFEPYEIAGN